MHSYYRPTWAEISLDALRHNFHAFRSVLPQTTMIMASVKANAYGHGAVPVAREMVSQGIDYLGVAFLDEALELRQAQIDAPILVLGYTPPEGFELARLHRITLNVYTEEAISSLEESSRMHADQDGLPLKIHIKVDTGMGRLGVRYGEQAVSFIKRAVRLSGVEVEGVFTHYACADETDKSYTMEQYHRFQWLLQQCEEMGIRIPIIHAGNSAAAIDLPGLSYSMVRIGISLYGLYPSDEVQRDMLALQPVLSLKTGIVHVKKLPAQAGVSYGATYVTQGEEIIATLPIGYADGFARSLTGKAQALVRGERVPIVGRICMDQCMIRVKQTDLRMQEEVVLIGNQGDERISAEEIAQQLGTIPYEVTCMIAKRVPRVYTSNGLRVAADNPLWTPIV